MNDYAQIEGFIKYCGYEQVERQIIGTSWKRRGSPFFINIHSDGVNTYLHVFKNVDKQEPVAWNWFLRFQVSKKLKINKVEYFDDALNALTRPPGKEPKIGTNPDLYLLIDVLAHPNLALAMAGLDWATIVMEELVK